MKLFRNIRLVLIDSKNVKRYLWYAFGEIFLVMIGISLAFQLDNWNEDRVKRNSEISYYENIKEQIIDDKALIEEQKKLNSSYLDQFYLANRIIESNDRKKIDTLGVIIRNLTQYTDFDRQGNVYETLVNSGEIKILHNQEIVNSIRDLEEKYIYVNRMENIHYDAMMSHVVAPISSFLKFSDASIQRPDEVYSFQFQNLILSLIQVMIEKDKVYSEALDEINKINKLIEIELNF